MMVRPLEKFKTAGGFPRLQSARREIGGTARFGRDERLAEMRADPGKHFFPAWIRRKGEALGVSQVTGDDPRLGLIKQEPGAVEKFHQGASLRKTPFGEEDEPPALLQIFSHAF